MLRNDLIFIVKIEEQNIELQQELCDLQFDLSLKARSEKGIELFKILDVTTYPRLRNFGLRFFSMFGSTYLCECSFSKMKYIKTDRRSCLRDASLSSLMRISMSNMQVDISSVIESYERRNRTKLVCLQLLLIFIYYLLLLILLFRSLVAFDYSSFLVD